VGEIGKSSCVRSTCDAERVNLSYGAQEPEPQAVRSHRQSHITGKHCLKMSGRHARSRDSGMAIYSRIAQIVEQSSNSASEALHVADRKRALQFGTHTCEHARAG